MKLYLRKKDFLIILMSVLYVIVMYVWLYNQDITFENNGMGSIFFSLIHALIGSFVLIYIINMIEKMIKRNTVSMVVISLYSMALYSIIASNKYYLINLYPGFVENNYIRFFGSLLVYLDIIICAYVWNRINKKHYNKFDQSSMNKVNIFALIIIIALFVLFELNGVLYNIGILTIANGTMEDYVNQVLLSLGLFLSVFNIKKDAKHKILQWLPVAVILLTEFIKAMYIGKRHLIIAPVFYLLILLIILQKQKTSLLRIVASFAPIGIMGMSIVLFAISGRYSDITYMSVRDLIYRFDISDYAITIASKTSFSDYSINSIIEGIYAAIPGATGETTQYNNVMIAAGLSATEDYNDTIFSMGAEIGGYIGLLLVPLFIIILLEYFDNFLKNNMLSGLRYSRFIMLNLFVIAESTWFMFILYARNAIITMILCLLFMWLFMIRKKRKLKKLANMEKTNEKNCNIG